MKSRPEPNQSQDLSANIIDSNNYISILSSSLSILNLIQLAHAR